MRKVVLASLLLLSSVSFAQNPPTSAYGLDLLSNTLGVSPAGRTRLVYDGANLKFSVNGAAYSLFGTVTSVGLSLPNLFTLSGTPVTGAGTLTGVLASQNANTLFSGPNGASGQPTFRLMLNADLPLSGVSAGSYVYNTINTKGVVTTGSNTIGIAPTFAAGALASGAAAFDLSGSTGNFAFPTGNAAWTPTGFSKTFTLNANALGTNINTIGLGLYNNTASTGVTQIQDSPTLSFLGHNWDGIDKTHQMQLGMRTGAGPLDNAAQLVLAYSNNGGAYADILSLFTINNGGNTNVNEGLVANTNITTTTQYGFFHINGGSALATRDANSVGTMTASPLGFFTTNNGNQYQLAIDGAITQGTGINFNTEAIGYHQYFSGVGTSNNRPGIWIDNNTSGTNGARQQNSGFLQLSGHGWSTGGGGFDTTSYFGIRVEPQTASDVGNQSNIGYLAIVANPVGAVIDAGPSVTVTRWDNYGHDYSLNASGTTTATVGAAAGTGGTCTVSGNDRRGTITIHVGTGLATGTLCTINDANPWLSTPLTVLLSAGGTNGANTAGVISDLYISSVSTTAFVLSTTTTLGLTTDYTVYYNQGG